MPLPSLQASAVWYATWMDTSDWCSGARGIGGTVVVYTSDNRRNCQIRAETVLRRTTGLREG